jgi:hypothetical protein
MLVVDQIERRVVAPFYLDVLHGNLVALAPSASLQDQIVRQMRVVAAEVTLDTAVYLWSRGWRQALMASWWAAVWQWPETVDQVEPLLLPSRYSFEGQAHCLALTRVRSPRARAVLMRYLDEYMPRPDLDYDQPWAMAALTLASTDAAEPVPGHYLEAWRQWTSGRRPAGLDELVDRLNSMRILADAVRRP